MPLSNNSMRAARVAKKLDEFYTLEEIPKPAPHEGEVLIEMKAAGFCHTDILTARGFFIQDFPVTGGHEIAGVIAEVGPGVQGFKRGDRVIALNQVKQCGQCYDCRNLDPAFCPNGHLGGLHSDGCFADYFRALSRNTVKIPDELPFEQAAPMTCAGVTIYNAIKKADLKAGQVIGISGLGALGHIGVQIAKALGLFTVGIDARPGPLELCKSFKLHPDLLIDASQVSAESAVQTITAELERAGQLTDRLEGLDAVVVTAESQAAINYALKTLARKGRFVLVSQPETVSIPFRDLIFKDITVVGSLQGNPKTLKEVVELAAKKGIVVKTRLWKLDEVNDLWTNQASPDLLGKNVVVW